MFLPPIKRLTTEEFPGQQNWISRLLYPVNQVFTALYNGLQHGITFQDNIAAQIQTVTFNNNSGELSSSNPIKFLLSNLSTSPIGVLIVQLTDTSSSPKPLAGAPFPTWSYDSANKQINITAITGLNSGQTYSATFLVF